MRKSTCGGHGKLPNERRRWLPKQSIFTQGLHLNPGPTSYDYGYNDSDGQEWLEEEEEEEENAQNGVEPLFGPGLVDEGWTSEAGEDEWLKPSGWAGEAADAPTDDLTRLACLWSQQELCGRRPAGVDPFTWGMP